MDMAVRELVVHQVMVVTFQLAVGHQNQALQLVVSLCMRVIIPIRLVLLTARVPVVPSLFDLVPVNQLPVEISESNQLTQALEVRVG